MNSKFSSFKIFSLAFGIIYTLAFYFNWNAFRYYPVLREFHLHSLPPKVAGPPINWYAWVVVAAVASAVLAFAVPRKWAERVPPGLSWSVPTLLLVVIFVYEKRWFF